MTRLPDWPERLAAYLARHAATPFAWGAHDCAGFAIGAVLAVTGRSPWPAPWHTRDGAIEQLRRAGGLVAAVDAVLPRLPGPRHAQRGDVVLMQHGTRRWLAVADGVQAWAPTAAGLVRTPVQHARVAWGVGRG